MHQDCFAKAAEASIRALSCRAHHAIDNGELNTGDEWGFVYIDSNPLN